MASYDDMLTAALSGHFCTLIANFPQNSERHVELPSLTGLLEQILGNPSEGLITAVVEMLYAYKTKVEMEDLKKLFTPWKHEVYQMVGLRKSNNMMIMMIMVSNHCRFLLLLINNY